MTTKLVKLGRPYSMDWSHIDKRVLALQFGEIAYIPVPKNVKFEVFRKRVWMHFYLMRPDVWVKFRTVADKKTIAVLRTERGGKL